MMQISRFKLSALAIATAMACSPAAFATNGYFVHGYGTKSSGMGGVGIALPQDAIAAATNPAGMSWVGSRADVGIMLFNPRRDASLDARGLSASGAAGTSSSAASGATLFLVPNAGFQMDMAGMTMGFTMYANGGMNTRYGTNIFTNAFAPAVGNTSTGPGSFGPPRGFARALEGMGIPASTINASLAGLYGNPNNGPSLGVNLSQLIMAPSASMKFGQNNSIGASLLIGYQRFRAYGLGLFQGMSSAPSNVTNKGDDDAWGMGVRLGWTGKLTDYLTLGATASSKVYMQKFTQYKGLFAQGGKFDIPANYGLGLALKPNDQWTVAFDAERILYGNVKAIANPGPTGDEFLGAFASSLSGGATGPVSRPLGTDGGYGFGWNNQTIYKLGVAYKYDDQWTMRAGFNYGKSPIKDSQNLFNILAPGVVEKHATLGFTYSPTKTNEISVGYMHAFRKDQSYTYTNPGSAASFGNQSYTANIGMSENSLEVSYGYKF